MRAILKHYGRHRGLSGATKVRLLRHLDYLQISLPADERHRLQEWLSISEYRGSDSLNNFISAPHGQPSTNGDLQGSQRSAFITQVKAELRECSVCAEDLENAQFPIEPCTDTCEHAITICTGCHTRSLNEQIANQPWDRIACPECPSLLSFANVKKFASIEDFQLYDKKALMSLMRQDPNFTHCLGAGCDGGQIHDGGNDQPIMTCNSCGVKTCFTHKLPWHTGLTCTEYDEQQRQRLEQEAASVQFMQANNFKQCPNPKCGLRLDKISGCNHMTCRSYNSILAVWFSFTCFSYPELSVHLTPKARWILSFPNLLTAFMVTQSSTNLRVGQHCRFEFCWLCFASYTDIRRLGNEAHMPNCRDYRANPHQMHQMAPNRGVWGAPSFVRHHMPIPEDLLED
ncbi:RING finger protein [Rutstroemia sp. NJR-2017a BBW]|nr:RING finger protein [Rutstroemia sp. NJR-2017a BBW]